MGCGHSKRPRGEEASPAVALCRDRSALLADAIDRRYELADAHRAYAAALGATGAALRDFLRAVHDATPPPPPPVPAAGDALLLAAPREGDDADAVVPPAVVASPDAASDEEDVDGGSGGHVYFPSPSDEDEASDDGGGLSESDYDDEAAEPSLPVPEPLHPAAPEPRPRPAQLLPPPQPLPQPPLQTMAPPYVPYDPGYGYPMQYSSRYPQPPFSYGPVVPTPSYGYGYGYGGGYGADMAGHSQSSYHISYAQSQPPPPYVPYEHRLPQATDAAAVEYYQYQGEAIPSSSYGGGYFPSTYPQGGGWSPVAGQAHAPPPPTPSPPRASAWDFLDPFQGVESFYDHQDHHPALDAPPAPAAHAAPPSLRSHDAAPAAGKDDDDIPELEDESGVVVGREDHAGDERTGVDDAKPADEDILGEEEEKEKENEGHIEFRSDDASTVERVESVVEAVEEEQLNNDDSAGVIELPVAVPEMKTYGDDVEVVQEIKVQFDRASNSAGNVCKMLEVGKMPYCQKKNSGLIRVPSVMICGRPSKGKAIMQFEEENAMECGNLSSTLQKLYLWEKKLLEEVKIVEKIRVHYEQKRKDQIKLYHGGAEAHKLEAVEIVVKKLSAKMSIAIKIVNTTAEKINNTRDEELWPQIHELIQGFRQMWHTMSECHQVQCRALSYARCIDSTMAVARFNQGHMDLVKQLELQLLDMTASFAGLFNAQKSYATSLNEWLKRGIRYEPEVTDDGVPPFSPGRLGAPPLFSVCNNWAVSMERISETEAVGAMQALASNVLGLWEQHRSEWRKAVLDNSNDLERDLRSMDMDELVLRKAVEARSKKLMLATNQRGISSSAQASEAPHAEAGLQACMNKVFEAMESFAAACENVYKDLHLRAEEEKA